MTTDRVHRIVRDFERGAITETSVCSDLIGLAADVGGEAIVSAASYELRTLLREHPLVAQPPDSPDDVVVVESYCGPALSRKESARIEAERRKASFRGAWALHRALHGCGGGG